jgi:hypothetical protein
MSFLERASNFAASMANVTSQVVEKDDVKMLRQEIKKGSLALQSIATAALVASVVIIAFSAFLGISYGIGFISTTLFLLGGAAGLLSQDVRVAADKSYQIADTPRKFVIFNSRSELTRRLAIDQARSLVNEILENTRILNHAHSVVFDRYWNFFSHESSFIR